MSASTSSQWPLPSPFPRASYGRPRSKTYSKSPYPTKAEHVLTPAGEYVVHYSDASAQIAACEKPLDELDEVGPLHGPGGWTQDRKRHQIMSQSSVSFMPMSPEMGYESGRSSLAHSGRIGYLRSLRLVPSREPPDDRFTLSGPSSENVTPSVRVVDGDQRWLRGRSYSALRNQNSFASQGVSSTHSGPYILHHQPSAFSRGTTDLDFDFYLDDNSRVQEHHDGFRPMPPSASPNVYVHCISPGLNPQTSFTSGGGSGRRRSYPSCESTPNVIVFPTSSPVRDHHFQAASPNYIRLMPSESSMMTAQTGETRPFPRFGSQYAFTTPSTYRNSMPSSPMDTMIYSDIIPSPPPRRTASSFRLPRGAGPGVGTSESATTRGGLNSGTEAMSRADRRAAAESQAVRRHTTATESTSPSTQSTFNVASPAVRAKSSREQQLETLLALIDGRNTIVQKKHVSGSVSSPGTDVFNFEWSLKHSPKHDSFGNAATASSSARTSYQEFPDELRERCYQYRNPGVAIIEEEAHSTSALSTSKDEWKTSHRTAADAASPTSPTGLAAQRLPARPATARDSVTSSCRARDLTHTQGAQSVASLDLAHNDLPPWVTQYYESSTRGPSIFTGSSAATTPQLQQQASPGKSTLRGGQRVKRPQSSRTQRTSILMLPSENASHSTNQGYEADVDNDGGDDNDDNDGEKPPAIPERSASRAMSHRSGVLSPSRTDDQRPRSPHLRRDKLAPRRLVLSEPCLPPRAATDDGESPYKLHQRVQLILFVAGFVCPPLWFAAALLPLPRCRSDHADTENGQMMVMTPGGTTRTRGEDPYLENARWWRRRNRMISPVGVLIILVLVILAAVGTM